MTPSVRRRGVLAFLLITFALTWLPFVPVLLGGPAMVLLMPFAPAVAAVVVRRWVTREGFRDLGLRPRLRTAAPWLGLALVWPLVTMPLAVAIGAAVGAGSPDLARVDLGQLVLWVAASAAAAPVFLGEELGWRGYLQVRILLDRPLLAAGVTGVVWSVWHFPLWLTVLHLAWWMLPAMTVSLVVSSVFLGWLQQRSRSVWGPAVGHSTNNTFESGFGATAFAGAGGSPWLPLGPTVVIVVVEAVVLLGIVARGGGLRTPSQAAPGRGMQEELPALDSVDHPAPTRG